MGYTEETTKTAEYVVLSTVETPPETNTKVFHGAAAVDAPPTVEGKCCKGKKMNKIKRKKRGLFLCCSNMQFENEEEAEKALAFLKGGDDHKGKLRMVMCCSNFQVGNNDEFGPKKIAK